MIVIKIMILCCYCSSHLCVQRENCKNNTDARFCVLAI